MSHTFPHTERLTITLAGSVMQELKNRSDLEGRSTSNLAAYLLERALADGGRNGEPQ